MSTTLIGERRNGSGSIRRNGEFIEIAESYTYVVRSTTKNEDRLTVLTTAGLPIVGITTLSSGAVCVGKDCERQEANPLYWEVTAEFSSARNDQQQNPDNPSLDPTTWIPIWRADIETEDILRITDASGFPYVNSAYQRFDEARMEALPIAVTKFTQYEPANMENRGLELRTIMERNMKVNKKTFRTFGPKKLLLIVTAAEYGSYGGYPAWKVDYVCKYKRGIPANTFFVRQGTGGWAKLADDTSGWRELRLDVGYYRVDAGKRYATTDENGNRIIGGLNGAGVFIDPDEFPAILAFDQYGDIEFSTFIRGA